MKTKLKISMNAPVTLGFTGLCLIATVLGLVSGGKITHAVFMTYHSSFLNPLTWLRFFTHVLGHNGLSHFLGNAAFLLLLGPQIEEKYGPKAMISVILVTALITGLVNYILFPHTGLCGASGVVFAFILLASFTGFREGEIPLTFILVAVIYLGQEIYQGIFVNDNVSNMAHIIGGITGGAAGYFLNRKQVIK